MNRFRAVSLVAIGVLVIGLASVALGMKEQPRPLEPPDYAVGRLPVSGPFVILQQGDTAWVQVHTDTTYCPGDPFDGHGGEAEGGPDGSETWCFEDAQWPEDFDPANNGEQVTVSDTCGTNSPWDTRCFTHVDVRTLPSQTGINFWHLDGLRTSADISRPGPAYTGSYALWCGSDSLWIDGNPVECGIWAEGKYPGYGNMWNCNVQLELSGYTGAGACTLAFDPRYDTECKYDYYYVDYYDGSAWQELAIFNAASNNSGSECGTPGGGNPDWFDFTDSGQPNSCAWVTRSVSGQPAFFYEFAASEIGDPPKFRWRFYSDGAWSDADGRGDTDGACFVDNVLFQGSGQTFVEDFEHNDYDTLAARGWTFPDPDPVAQCWHQIHDVDPPYEGNEAGQDQSTCTLDSSVCWRARPDGGYASGTTWRNGWFYRLQSPIVDIPAGDAGTGCVVQYDQFMCALDYTCDYTDTKVRFYDTIYDKWCPWTNIDDLITYGGCTFWNFNDQENVTQFYGPTSSQMQFAWDLMDVSSEGDFCEGKHKSTDNVVDNVSIGFYDGTATIFSIRYLDLLQDSFHESICTYNSLFDPYSTDTLDLYNVRGGAPEIVKENKFYLSVTDKDGLVSVDLWGSIDGGNIWESKPMVKFIDADPNAPELGGEYYENFCPGDFPNNIGSGITAEGFWEKGIELWYYVKAEDEDANVEYWPGDADPGDPDHTGTREDFTPSAVMSILPIYPDDYTGTKILLVDGYPRWNIDYTECMAADDNTVDRLVEIYEKTLADAGYCFDVYNISGGGSSGHIHPLQYTEYDCIFWFTGPYFSNYTVDEEAQIALRAYMSDGGKVVFCGDQLAYSMDPTGSNEDSLGGEFLGGILGTEYIEEMEGQFDKPYVLLEAPLSVVVQGVATPIALDSLLVYRECPTLRDMSYIRTLSPPLAGYTAQPLLYVLNAAGTADPADGAIYVEKGTPPNAGQCAFVNYDLSGFVTHRRTECDGTGGGLFPVYPAAAYYGRVDLVEVILNDLFGLVPPFPGGGGGTAGGPTTSQFKWALNQNYPNPAKAGTDIKFEIAKASNVSIKVYNAMGQLVRTLENKRLEPGKYASHWDGTNGSGQRVSSGVYFYKMEAGQFAATKKMLVVK